MYNKEVQRKYDNSDKGKERHNTDKYKDYRKKYQKIYAPLYRKKRKQLIIKYYGNKCACCRETEIRFLSIDHIEGGGSKHIREIERSGHNFYSWIYRNKYPKGFQVLCYNCNRGKGRSKQRFCPVHHPELYDEKYISI